MNSVTRHFWSLVRKSCNTTEPLNNGYPPLPQLQQYRGIRVKVLNGNLEQALALMQRKMQSSGIERMIKQEQRFHIKNSEKRVLARKNLERRLRSEDLAKKLKAIMIKKVRFSSKILPWIDPEDIIIASDCFVCYLLLRLEAMVLWLAPSVGTLFAYGVLIAMISGYHMHLYYPINSE
ncbi:hypothetical protein RIF29_18815 [Crotalaria pallida]|uniref:Ribosomal protein S21 n=1 Tax=Crotalaria pallida TaxID=3830 RepID=A0AAN9F1S8_CROPI